MSVTAPVLAPSAPLLDASMASLARELAQDIRPPEEILADYGFVGPSDPEWRKVCESKDFRELLAESVREWSAVDSTPKRIRFKALAALELEIAELHTIAATNASTEHRINAIKVMKDLAGFTSTGGIGGGNPLDNSGGFSVTIVIGDTTTKVTLPRTPIIEGQLES